MSAITFDTHKYIKRLTAVGMPEEQAEVLAEEQAMLIDERLATKQDLEHMKMQLTIRLGAICATAIGITATLMKLIH
jgi:hypothetical protein